MTSSMTADKIISIAYGIKIQDCNDPYIVAAEHIVDAINAIMIPGSYLVNLLPFREYHSNDVIYFNLNQVLQ